MKRSVAFLLLVVANILGLVRMRGSYLCDFSSNELWNLVLQFVYSVEIIFSK